MSKESKEERDALMRRSALEERARVVAWLRSSKHGTMMGLTKMTTYGHGVVPCCTGCLCATADAIERGKHDDARVGGAQEPRSGGTRGRP